MRTSGIMPGDLIVVCNRRDEIDLCLVEARGPNGVTALPLSRARPQVTVTGYQITGHYRRKQGHLHELRALTSRIRQRFGVSRDAATHEQHRAWGADTVDTAPDEAAVLAGARS